jgi:hypothetical protein
MWQKEALAIFYDHSIVLCLAQLGIQGFKKDRLAHVEPVEKNVLPNAETIEQVPFEDEHKNLGQSRLCF